MSYTIYFATCHLAGTTGTAKLYDIIITINYRKLIGVLIMKNYGLVLGGGGAKGGYEIGVWKALRELNVDLKAVVGASVGALNGALIVQDDYDAAYDLWTDLTMEKVIKVEKEIEEGKGKILSKGMFDTAYNALKEGGLDVTPLKEIMDEVLDEDKVRNSKVDFGLVTFSVTDFKPVRVFKKDIPYGKLKDYLLASSCFPAFKRQEIEDKKFIDGGMWDNIPASLMIEKGIKDMIIVDVSGPGLNRKINEKDLNIIHVKNSEDLGGTLDFNGDRAKRNIEIGYLDTLKSFGKLKGSSYYLISSAEDKEMSIKDVSNDDLKKLYYFLGIEMKNKVSAQNKLIITRILNTLKKYAGGSLKVEDIYIAMMEITAEQLQIERGNKYKKEELLDEIIGRYEEIKGSKDFSEYISNLSSLLSSKSMVDFNRELKNNIIDGKFLIAYNADVKGENEGNKRFRRFLAMTFPKITISNLFISIILERKNFN
ncbi:MAG TPA: patatin [Clostridiaceae bacterium]|nr:patatin [Clostridiaceae bacterium]HBG39776.1 patatin [Clostridiaceae bacterium]